MGTPIRILVTITFISLLAFGCRQSNRPEEIKIKIICTTDVHGAIFPYDLIMDKPVDHSLSQVYSYVEQERNGSDQWVVLLDNGDILQGDPLIYYYNFQKTDVPHVVAQTMNFMQYDAATVGNHDIEPGPAVYNKVNDEFDFPWLAANAVEKATGEPYFLPYTVIEKHGVKVAVLGLITPGIPRWLPEYTWEGLFFEDMIVSARHWVEVIKTVENPDVLVGLFHSGVDYNYSNQDSTTPFNENASLLVAEQVPGFDVVFVGHDHKGWNKTVTDKDGGEVLIVGATSNANSVAEVTIDLKFDRDKNRYQKIATGSVVDMTVYPPHKGFIERFNPAFEEAAQFVARPIGELSGALSSRQVLFGDAAFTDLIHRLQLELTGADISFTSSQSFDLVLDEGTLFVRDMFKLQRYENLLYSMTLSGKEIKDYLEFSYGLWFNQMSTASDHLLLFRKDADGNLMKRAGGGVSLEHPFWNLDSAEGIIYTVDVSKPVGNRINIQSFTNGDLFKLNDHYSVAINSYRGNGGGDHLTLGAGIEREQLNERIVFSSEKDLRWYAIQWIEQQGVVNPEITDNWRVIPEKWNHLAVARDYELLFGRE
jgi:2',3'-cyclic-nucleotide 2'-phosphodiesterase / 3'-nucleotidase